MNQISKASDSVDIDIIHKSYWNLELGVSFTKRADLLDRVATDGIGEVLFGILEPGVESGRFLGKRQVELFNLPELFLHAEQALLTSVRAAQQCAPTTHHVTVTVQNRWCLIVTGAY